ncbi:MAG: FliH/SctL family protein [Alphaproteobacteria bacterium]|nr:FliH/SctL family protein [Alphaproteobacteria bacterium]
MSNMVQLKNIYDSNLRNGKTHTLTEEQFNKAKEEARSDGFQAGRNDAILESTHRQETLQRELLYNLQISVEKSIEEQNALHTKIYDLILSLTLALFRKTFPAYAAKAGDEEVTSFIQSQISQLKDLSELLITVHPDRLDSIKNACDQIKSQLSLKLQISVKSSSDFEPTDCLINWESGYIEKRLNNIINDLSSLLFEVKNESTTE